MARLATRDLRRHATSRWASLGLGAAALLVIVLLAPISWSSKLLAVVGLVGGYILGGSVPLAKSVCSRFVGPALLGMALIPTLGISWGYGFALLAILGVACNGETQFTRVVFGSPLVLSAELFRNGPVEGLSGSAWFLLLWAGLSFGMVAIQSGFWEVGRPQEDEVEDQPGQTSRLVPLSQYSSHPALAKRTHSRVLHVPLAMVIVASVATFVGYSIDVDVLPAGFDVGSGDANGQRFTSHPGMSGGLDAGDRVDLSDEVVLRVRSDSALYWRATTYDRFDGRSWSSSGANRQLRWSGGGFSPPVAEVREGEILGDEVIQEFRTERAGLDTILGAPDIDTVWAAPGSGILGEDGTIRTDEPLGVGAKWTVRSTTVANDPGRLRSADQTPFADSGLLDRFADGSEVAPAVAALARDLTADATTTYDKVLAIESWMDENLEYDRNIDSLPGGADVVEHLLFSSQKGYCEQIGSALVMMLRSLGIPARIAVGFVPSEYDTSTNEWVSRGTDAHAWAEVYFPGAGWIGFDPTAGVPQGAEAETLPLYSWKRLSSLVLIFGLVAMIVLVVAGGRRRRKKLLMPPILPSTRVHTLQRRFDQCGDNLGRRWGYSMTVQERALDLVASGVESDVAEEAARLLQALHYSDASVGEDANASRSEMAGECEREILELERQCYSLSIESEPALA